MDLLLEAVEEASPIALEGVAGKDASRDDGTTKRSSVPRSSPGALVQKLHPSYFVPNAATRHELRPDIEPTVRKGGQGRVNDAATTNDSGSNIAKLESSNTGGAQQQSYGSVAEGSCLPKPRGTVPALRTKPNPSSISIVPSMATSGRGIELMIGRGGQGEVQDAAAVTSGTNTSNPGSKAAPTPNAPLAQRVHPLYTNFSLVPGTATRYDIEPFLQEGQGQGQGESKGEERPSTCSNMVKKRLTIFGKKKGPSLKSLFPYKLHQVLSDPSLSDVIAWMPHGRSWSIVDKSAFVERVSKKYFSQNRLDSFKRQATGWGFRRKKEGTDRGSYYHELFLRGMPHLVPFLEKPAKACSVDDEPDLFKISLVYPVPVQGAAEPVLGKEEDDRKRRQEETVPVVATRTLAQAAASFPRPYSSMVSGTQAPLTRIVSPFSTTAQTASSAKVPTSLCSYPQESALNDRTTSGTPCTYPVTSSHRAECSYAAPDAAHTSLGDKRPPSVNHQDLQRKRQCVQGNFTTLQQQPTIAFDKFGPVRVPQAPMSANGPTVLPQHNLSLFSLQAAAAPPAPVDALMIDVISRGVRSWLQDRGYPTPK